MEAAMRLLALIIAALITLTSCTIISEEEPVHPIPAENPPEPVIIIEEVPPSGPAVTIDEGASACHVPPAGIEEEPEEEPAEEPAFSIAAASAGLQSAELEITYPAGTDLWNISIEGGGHISSIRAMENAASVMIEGLESLTDYHFRITYEGLPVTDAYGVTTASFAGRYSWKPADGSEAEPFVLDVREAPASSAYRYYIYLNPEDSAFPEGYGAYQVRIAPLVDEGEPSLDGMKYRETPEAYRWTNHKLNTGSMTPSRIEYVRAAGTENGDEIRTAIASVALGFTAEADVRFIFRENEDKAYLAFFNKMTPGIANSFLKKNPSPGIRPYEDDEFWYVLERE